MLENNFQPCITEATRIVDTHRPSLPDNIFVNKPIHNPITGNILEKISYDHLPNFIIYESEPSHYDNVDIKIRDMSKLNRDDFLADLQNLYLNIKTVSVSLNTNDSYSYFHKNYLKLLNKHAPFKFLSNKEKKTRRKPWLTKGILTSINKKRKLFKKYKSSHIQETYDKYKIYRDLLNTLCKKSKKMYYKSYFTTNANNSKKTWIEINNILNRRKKQHQNFLLSNNGIMETNKHKIANKFNHYFTSVADSLKNSSNQLKISGLFKKPKCKFYVP